MVRVLIRRSQIVANCRIVTRKFTKLLLVLECNIFTFSFCCISKREREREREREVCHSRNRVSRLWGK